MSMSIPAGKPSMTPPIASPWLSPKVVRRSMFPIVLLMLWVVLLPIGLLVVVVSASAVALASAVTFAATVALTVAVAVAATAVTTVTAAAASAVSATSAFTAQHACHLLYLGIGGRTRLVDGTLEVERHTSQWVVEVYAHLVAADAYHASEETVAVLVLQRDDGFWVDVLAVKLAVDAEYLLV